MHISMKKILARPIWYPWPLLSLFFTSNNAYKHENCSRRSRTVFGRCRWCRYGSRMEVPALLNQDLGHQSGFNIQGAFKTSYHIVLDDLWSMQSHRISAKVLILNAHPMSDIHTKNQRPSSKNGLVRACLRPFFSRVSQYRGCQKSKKRRKGKVIGSPPKFWFLMPHQWLTFTPKIRVLPQKMGSGERACVQAREKNKNVT